MIGDFLAKAAVAAVALVTMASCGKRTELSVSGYDNTSNVKVTEKKNVKDDEEKDKTEKDPSEEVFKLDISVKSDESFPNKYVTEGFNTVMQLPELPTGCEVTALCELLNYLGFDIDKVTLADEFMPMDNNGVTTMREAYIGDPKSEEGFGCFTPVIVQTADDYFESVKSPCYAVDMTGRSLRELFYQIAQGRPVVVWSTIDLIISPSIYRWTTYEGEEMWFNDFQHCVVVYGYDYDENVVHVADPLKGNVKYNMDDFNKAYELMGNQAVLVCGNSETKGKLVKLEDKPQSQFLSRNKAERKLAEEEEARRKAEEEERKKAEEEEAKRRAEEEKQPEPAPDEEPVAEPAPDEEPPLEEEADEDNGSEEEQE